MKAAQVGASEYDARIRRADDLASKHPFAAEVLRFYSQVADFQKKLYAEVKKDLSGKSSEGVHRPFRPGLPAAEATKLLPKLKIFLNLIEQAAPPALAAAARAVSNLDAPSQRCLLQAYWELGGV